MFFSQDIFQQMPILNNYVDTRDDIVQALFKVLLTLNQMRANTS
jgi:hypothetical protein